jgi:hypothetical protein
MIKRSLAGSKTRIARAIEPRIDTKAETKDLEEQLRRLGYL